MGLNPFKESNLNDLQNNISTFFSEYFSGINESIKDWWNRFVNKGSERLTVMFIPHSEKRIVNFHISIFAISAFIGFIIATITITSILIINHSTTIKEVSKLKKYGKNSKLQIQKYKEEITKMYDAFQKLKPEITHLYGLTPESDIDSLWSKGGEYNPNPSNEIDTEASPPLEVLNIQEVEKELQTTKDVLAKIKTFLEYRKKIIENTPSIWPVNGYIISRFGERTSPNNFAKEFHYGIDIDSPPGSEIRATAPGKVVDVLWDHANGLSVSVKHKYGFTTTYSHCQRVSVEADQKVAKSEVIGYVGTTCKTTRPICYYQVKIGTEFVDPIPYLNSIIR
jgi:murein DD-endopeptidase MepM/ murein hydrolase activator NlpD